MVNEVRGNASGTMLARSPPFCWSSCSSLCLFDSSMTGCMARPGVFFPTCCCSGFFRCYRSRYTALRPACDGGFPVVHAESRRFRIRTEINCIRPPVNRLHSARTSAHHAWAISSLKGEPPAMLFRWPAALQSRRSQTCFIFINPRRAPHASFPSYVSRIDCPRRPGQHDSGK